MLEKLLNSSARSYKHPLIVLAIAAAVTVFLVLGIPKIKFDTDVKSMLPEGSNDIAVSNYYESETLFGSSNLIFIGLQSADAYSPQSLATLGRIQDEIIALNQTLPLDNIARVLKLSKDDAAKIRDGLGLLGWNAQNAAELLGPLLSDPAKLAEGMGIDAGLAARFAKAMTGQSPSDLYKIWEAPVSKTQSLINADYIVNQDDTLQVQKLLPSDQLDAASIAELKKRVESWNLYRGALVSDDGTLSAILVELANSNKTVYSSVDAGLNAILDSHKDPGLKTYLAGESVISDLIGNSMFADISLLMPLVILVVLLILFLCFRRWEGLVYPILVVLIAVASAVGIMAWTEVPMTVISVAMPVLLVAISSAYAIHQMNHYFLDTETNKLSILRNNMKSVGLAILLSGITVMVGFGALMIERFVPVRNFGIFTALGDFFAIGAALFVLPAVILLSKKPKTYVLHDTEKGFVGGILKGFVKLNEKASVPVLVVSVALCVVMLIGSFSVKTELNNVSLFKSDSPIHVADDVLNEKLAGTQTLNIILDSDLSPVVDRVKAIPAVGADAGSLDTISLNTTSLDAMSTGAADAVASTGTNAAGGAAAGETAANAASGEPIPLTTPAVLNKVDAFAAEVQKRYPFVTKVVSFTDILKKMNQEMSGGSVSDYTIPGDPALISQYLLIFSGDTKSVLSPNHDKLRITLTMKRVPNEMSESVRQFADEYFDQGFRAANHLQVQASGTAHLYYVANELLVKGSNDSIVICLAVVFVLLILVLQNLIMSIVAMIPILMTLLINFGTLGFFGIPLNSGTAMVSSIAIGIGVDYSIHYITWFRNELRKKPDLIPALKLSIMNKGRAILYNMFVIVGGFLVLCASRFVPLVQFGALVALCMVSTAVGALVVVPAIVHVLARWNFKFLYLGTKKEI